MHKRILEGVVTSNSRDKTVTVLITRRVMHPKYKKYINVSRKYHVHDEKNEKSIGEHVLICETRPISKTKCWIIVNSRSER